MQEVFTTHAMRSLCSSWAICCFLESDFGQPTMINSPLIVPVEFQSESRGICSGFQFLLPLLQ